MNVIYLSLNTNFGLKITTNKKLLFIQYKFNDTVTLKAKITIIPASNDLVYSPAIILFFCFKKSSISIKNVKLCQIVDDGVINC